MACRLLRVATLASLSASAAGLLQPPLRAARSPRPLRAARMQLDGDALTPDELEVAAAPTEPALPDEVPAAAAAAADAAAPADDAAEAAARGAAAAAAGGEVNLAAMSFDERLAYLAAKAADEVPVPKKEPNLLGGDEDSTLFGISDTVETQWWRPEFWALCFKDLGEMTWPSRKQVVQTVITSQVAFAGILVMILFLDAVFESGMRSLLLDEPFRVTVDAIMKKR